MTPLEAITLACELYDKDPPDAAVVNVWQDALGGLSADDLAAALQVHFTRSKFFPRPAELLEIHLDRTRPAPAPLGVKPDWSAIIGHGSDREDSYACWRCKDTGLVSFRDEQQRHFTIRCHCPRGDKPMRFKSGKELGRLRDPEAAWADWNSGD